MLSTSTIAESATAPTTLSPAGLRFLWLEVTGRCNLTCRHCYADSGPDGTHGLMTTADWLRVIGQAAALGTRAVQFVGGEPTLHPDLPEFVGHALGKGLAVEVYSNLVAVSQRLWAVFRQPGVSLATSWYSDDPAEHQQITGGSPRAHQRTLANIGLARAYGIPVRAGLVSFGDRQRVEPGLRQLARLGITRTKVDHVRSVGRGGNGGDPDTAALCGRCADGRLAVLPDGNAYLCVFSRWPELLAGSVLTQSLEEIAASPATAAIRHELQAEFARRPRRECDPDDGCDPAHCGPDCDPGP
jgi:sulfatase maturation enzyme AslB (radical SAM superfamily)